MLKVKELDELSVSSIQSFSSAISQISIEIDNLSQTTSEATEDLQLQVAQLQLEQNAVLNQLECLKQELRSYRSNRSMLRCLSSKIYNFLFSGSYITNWDILEWYHLILLEIAVVIVTVAWLFNFAFGVHPLPGRSEWHYILSFILILLGVAYYGYRKGRLF